MCLLQVTGLAVLDRTFACLTEPLPAETVLYRAFGIAKTPTTASIELTITQVDVSTPASFEATAIRPVTATTTVFRYLCSFAMTGRRLQVTVIRWLSQQARGYR